MTEEYGYEFKKSNLVAYAYTVKVLSNKTMDPNYEQDVFSRWRKLGVEFDCSVSERDSKGKLHYHGIIYLRKGFYRRKLVVRGYHMKLEELYDRAGWIRYIEKDLKYKHYEEQAKELSDELIEDVMTPRSRRSSIPKFRLF